MGKELAVVHFNSTATVAGATATATTYEIARPKRIDVSNICNVLGDPITMKMFLEGVTNYKGRLSRKQYYHRLSNLKIAGLIRRSKYSEDYEMTSTGLVIRRALSLMERTISYKMNISLRFYDKVRRDNPDISPSEWAAKLFESDTEIRDIVLGK